MKFDTDSKKLLHIGFEISLIAKGIDGILEILGGLLFLFINPVRLNHWVYIITSHEISEDPHDVISNILIKMSHGFSSSLQNFMVMYLAAHGLSKLVLVLLLYKKKLWAYPLSIAFLLVFIGYQIHRYMYDHSIFMILLTVFDVLMIYLVVMEYKRVKSAIGGTSHVDE